MYYVLFVNTYVEVIFDKYLLNNEYTVDHAGANITVKLLHSPIVKHDMDIILFMDHCVRHYCARA